MVYAQKYARKAKKPIRKATKARRKYASTGVKKLANDVRILKRQVAGEKKTFTDGLVPQTSIGQCNVNADSVWALDMTPTPPSGTGYSDRVGRQIKLVSMSVQYQVSQQVNAKSPISIDMYICRIVGAPQNVNTLYNNFMNFNPITGVRDYMSTRDLNYFKDFRVIKKIKCYLPQDAATGNQVIKTGRFSCKLNHFVNFDEDSLTVTDGQLAMFAFASTGNKGAVNSTLPNVVNQDPGTGAVIQTYTKFWYTDN